jgi:hypothetical protein
MRLGLMVLGFLAIVLVTFVGVPAERTPAVVGEQAFAYVPDPDANGKPFQRKSGLRIAVEGRLKWLGLL